MQLETRDSMCTHVRIFTLPLSIPDSVSTPSLTPTLLPFSLWQVVKGLEVVRAMEDVDVDEDDCPKKKVVIANCGQL